MEENWTTFNKELWNFKCRCYPWISTYFSKMHKIYCTNFVRYGLMSIRNHVKIVKIFCGLTFLPFELVICKSNENVITTYSFDLSKGTSNRMGQWVSTISNISQLLLLTKQKYHSFGPPAGLSLIVFRLQ